MVTVIQYSDELIDFILVCWERLAWRLPRIKGKYFALLACCLYATKVQGVPILMSTDGVLSVNNTRAASLGHTVTTDTYVGITQTSVAALSAFDVVWLKPNPGFVDANGDSFFGQLQLSVDNGGNRELYASGGGTLSLLRAGLLGFGPTRRRKRAA